MSSRLEFGCLPTAIGSMPHTDPEKACSLVRKYLPDIPAWPQLPRRSDKEKMNIQFSEGFPDIALSGDKISIKPSPSFETELERIYNDCREGNLTDYGTSAEYAAGLHVCLSSGEKPNMVKGQITGPITWGLSVTRQDGLGIIYDETLAEVEAKFLRLKASWQERALKKVSANTIVFVDEPYLVSLGSVFTPVPEGEVPALLREVLSGITGIKGMHCCGNTDWPVLLNVPIDILSFDAYNYASSLSAYCEEVESFLGRGGVIAWGIVPNDEEALAKESLSTLYDRLQEAMAPFTRNSTSFRQIVRQGLITPSCGLTSLSCEAAEQALELTAELSNNLRARYTL